ncbi:hypothetical protein CRG98_017100 [Punica granatum]|uniref:Sulfotransferase n=1 Tax=Punica granatum TaxID=22663 RepID=A0A2I0K443_PUNGR|nr:hypothetical protein CRG98_017100 [Punica granatum]
MADEFNALIQNGSSSTLLERFIKILSDEFAMKDLGPLHFFLGIHATRPSGTLFISQQKYISDVLSRFGLDKSTAVKTPLSSRTHLSLTDGDLLDDPTEYHGMVGTLQYITITKPDICYAVNLVSQFMHAPRTTQFQAVKRILRYLLGTSTHGLHFQSSDLQITAYIDADWAGCPDTRRVVSINGPFWDHVLGYYKASLEMPHKVFFLTYEEMKEKPREQLKRLADFLGCPFSEDEEEVDGGVDEILRLCSFDNLSKLEVNQNGKLLTGHENRSFFRKGEVGDWVSYLTPDMIERIHRIIEEKFHGSGLKL